MFSDDSRRSDSDSFWLSARFCQLVTSSLQSRHHCVDLFTFTLNSNLVHLKICLDKLAIRQIISHSLSSSRDGVNFGLYFISLFQVQYWVFNNSSWILLSGELKGMNCYIFRIYKFKFSNFTRCSHFSKRYSAYHR